MVKRVMLYSRSLASSLVKIEANWGLQLEMTWLWRPNLGNTCWKKILAMSAADMGFVARMENYLLQKTMVYHNQDRIIAMGNGEIGDEIHGDLLEGAGAFEGNGHKGRNQGVSVDLIGLAHGAASDEFADKGSHTRPPIILLEKGNGMEVATMDATRDSWIFLTRAWHVGSGI